MKRKLKWFSKHILSHIRDGQFLLFAEFHILILIETIHFKFILEQKS